jgi:hypothetical protein
MTDFGWRFLETYVTKLKWRHDGSLHTCLLV